MAIDEQHVALPKLYGAPAYARPPRTVDESPRPFDPDDLPITAFQTEEDREILSQEPEEASADHPGGRAQRAELMGRPFRLRALAGKLLKGN